MNQRGMLWVLAGTLLLGTIVRWPLLERSGLWVDEVFSLAIATGHSLEHPARAADPALGDFVEGPRARPARAWRAYCEHDDPPAGPRRVLRAVMLSDTSPPLYYLLLWAWTRVLGTSDLALRGFSLACALFCLPFLARLARWSGGRSAVAPACVLFTLAPLSIYYGTEGRMYSLLWLWVLAFAWLTVLLRTRGRHPGLVLAWIAVGAAGLLTHYFFAFVWAAVTLLLFARPGRCGRWWIVLCVGATCALILPWYARVGDSLGRWRITQDWLKWEPWQFARGDSALQLFLGYLSGSEPNLWGEQRQARAVSLALFALLGVVLFLRRRGGVLHPRMLLLWVWLAAAWAGPLVFDALRGTYTVAVARYAIAGLPAALLLAGVALASLGPWLRTGMLIALLVAWLPHLDRLYHRASRAWCPLRATARALHGKSPAEDLILVHSIPSGVLGIARYYEGEAELAAWVEQLGERRVPESLLDLAHGKRMVHLVRMHEVGWPCPVEDWLRANTVLDWEGLNESARLVHFRPKDAPAF